jgi:hypothetical protein
MRTLPPQLPQATESSVCGESAIERLASIRDYRRQISGAKTWIKTRDALNEILGSTSLISTSF